MEGATSGLGIDVGTENIRLARVVKNGPDLKIVSLLQERLISIDGKSIAGQIKAMIKRAKIRATRAVFGVPGFSAFIKIFNLPKTTPKERLERVIKFTARQLVPFPLDKTALAYQVFKSQTPNKVEVILVAVKRDFLARYLGWISQTGLHPVAVTASSLAMFNFHLVNGLGNGLACVNLGAGYTEVAISRFGPQRLGFTRSFSLAGLVMDVMINSSLGSDHGDDRARLIKENDTAIAPHSFAGDKIGNFNLKASQIATEVATKIAFEIRRTLDFYISQPQGLAVDGIVLSGGLAKMPYLADFLAETLGIGVTLAQPKNLEIWPDKVESKESYATAVGLALQGVGLAPIAINLI